MNSNWQSTRNAVYEYMARKKDIPDYVKQVILKSSIVYSDARLKWVITFKIDDVTYKVASIILKDALDMLYRKMWNHTNPMQKSDEEKQATMLELRHELHPILKRLHKYHRR